MLLYNIAVTFVNIFWLNLEKNYFIKKQFLLVELLFQNSSCCFYCFVCLFRIFSTSLSHVWTTAAATAYDRCDTFNKISSVRSCFLSWFTICAWSSLKLNGLVT